MDELETMAANVDETEVSQPTSPVDNGAKAYAERLNRDRERIRTEERERIAKDFGYESWTDYVDSQTNSKLLDNGLDPETVRPVLKDIIKSDPDYIAAMEYKKKQEALQAELWGEQEVKKLNDKFGTTYKGINDLDEETIKLFNSGMSLDRAYASQHYDEIQINAAKKARVENGKEHLRTTEGSSGVSEPGQSREITKAQLDKFKAINPYATEEQIKAYINRTKN